ncbi:unnamed protein product [Vitrella brassicaformis CCMP3155]|uniref:Major facilitator superfamily (MFS) profile domain-containing protein n=1 Tax=Vitrella brassicaformis (strain CCMP3155) TaxID=1169540 RepID=A0A0G4GYY3_VITBC|nr:unnamed protein product [Vitrella brassicaformis CCMP3155]|eukprot:CEM36248.1 unnamed protein product [Vitrella brassicaformis CCMP3155]
MAAGKVVAVCIAMALCDIIGRRPLLLFSLFMMTVSYGHLGVTPYFLTLKEYRSEKRAMPFRYFALVAFILLCSAFSLGMGPMENVVGAEVLPLKLRAKGNAVLTLLNRVTVALLTFYFLSLKEAIGFSTTMYIFAGVCLAGVLWVHLFVPETANYLLEEGQYLARRQSTQTFRQLSRSLTGLSRTLTILSGAGGGGASPR